MNNNMNNSIREDILSEYIDSLNSEETPVSLGDDDIDDDMLELFETVRAVKRLKGTEAEELLTNKEKLHGKRQFNKYIKIATTIAAVFVIFISSLAIKNFAGNIGGKSSTSEKAAANNMMKSMPDESNNNATNSVNNKDDAVAGGNQAFTTGLPDTSMYDKAVGNATLKSEGSAEYSADSNKSNQQTAPKAAIKSAKNNEIVYEMQNAFEGLSSYSGVIEIQTISNGKVTEDENVRITYKRPDKYITTEITRGSTIKEYSDGDKLYMVDGSKVSIDYVSPEKNLWKYHTKVYMLVLFLTFP
jgi:hypothetical protein